MNAWERQKKESGKAYEAAKLYFEMGTDRSVEAVAAQLRKSAGLLYRWSRAYGWVARAEAFDRQQDSLKRAAADKAAIEEAKKWERRRAKIRDDSWDIAVRLQKKALEMMEHPLTKETFDDERGVVVIEPAKWAMRDAAAYVETANKLARLAAEMETERTKVVVDIKSAAREAAQDIVTRFGLSMEQAVVIAAQNFGLSEADVLDVPEADFEM